MNIAEEITQVDAQLADAERAQESAVDLRARRDKLVRAQQLDAEAQQRVREARDAAMALRAAEDADRAATAAPIITTLKAIDAELAGFEAEAEAKLWAFVRDMRTLHERYAAVVTRHADALAQLRAVSPEDAHMIPVREPETVRAFVTRRWGRFNGVGLAADGSNHWQRALAAEEAGR